MSSKLSLTSTSSLLINNFEKGFICSLCGCYLLTNIPHICKIIKCPFCNLHLNQPSFGSGWLENHTKHCPKNPNKKKL